MAFLSGLFLFFFMMALTVPLAIVFGLLAMFLDYTQAPLPVTSAVGELMWTSSTSSTLMAIPFFILMGEILVRSGIANRMFEAIRPWLSWLPGGLMHANVISCALFASTSGSSLATTTMIGTTALPQIDAGKYNERIFLGSLACGGTLGILIPPSINMVIYGILTNTSIPRLFLAGIIPGLLLVSLFMAAIIVLCLYNREWGGIQQDVAWKERLVLLPDLLPPIFLFVIVVGSIYAGVATVTEAAALGVVMSLALAAGRSMLSVGMIISAIESTINTVGMILFIISAAMFLNFALAASGFISAVNTLFARMDLSPVELLLFVILFYVVLGCIMEVLSMIVLTVPIITPLMVSAGYDAVWLGVLIILLSEIAIVTPPVGTNLFVIQAIRKKGAIIDVMIGILPFLLAMFVLVALISFFPQVALWIPDRMT